MAIEHRCGDLFKQQDLDAWGHGCNTQGVMGAGIARQFKAVFPDMYKQYAWMCRERPYQLAGDVFSWTLGVYFRPKVVYNLSTQVNPGREAVLSYVDSASLEMFKRAFLTGIRSIGLPEIGCGLGGLKREDVEEVLERNLDAVNNAQSQIGGECIKLIVVHFDR